MEDLLETARCWEAGREGSALGDMVLGVVDGDEEGRGTMRRREEEEEEEEGKKGEGIGIGA